MRRKKREELARVLSSWELRRCGEVVRRRRKGGRARLRLIYPKVIALKKWVKSKPDVAHGMLLDVLHQ
jgi:hypothetical protein